MQLHELKPKTKNRPTMLVGRGGKRGKTAGRGTKGQNSRAGRKKRPEVRDFIKRLPKLRGYAFNTIQTKPVAVNLDALEKAFSNGDTVTAATLKDKGVIKLLYGKVPAVKILSQGDLTKKLVITGCAVSAGARAKIEKAGGTIN